MAVNGHDEWSATEALDRAEREAYLVVRRADEGRELLRNTYFINVLAERELDTIYQVLNETDPETRLVLLAKADAARELREHILGHIQDGLSAQEDIEEIQRQRDLIERQLDQGLRRV